MGNQLNAVKEKKNKVTNNCPVRAGHAKSRLWHIPLLKGFVTGTEPKQPLGLGCLPPAGTAVTKIIQHQASSPREALQVRGGSWAWLRSLTKELLLWLPASIAGPGSCLPKGLVPLVLKMNFKKAGVDMTLVWLAEEQR